MSKAQLPQEIVAQVFEYIQPRDLLACLSVCHSWYVHAQHRFYKQIEFFQFESIDRFISYMEVNPDHPNLLVKKITFISDEFHARGDLPAFQKRFKRLVGLCSNVETLACSPRLNSFVIQALYSLPTTLENLSAFPHSSMDEYVFCANLYCNTLKEYAMYNDNDSVRTNFGELRSFPRLQKLNLMDAPARNLADVEHIMVMCRNLEDLSVEVNDDEMEYYSDDFDEFDDEDSDWDIHRGFTERLQQMGIAPQRLRPQSPKPQHIQHYPKMKKLLFRSGDVELDLSILNNFLRKLTNLERLELDAVDILTAEKPREQFNELKTLLDFIHTLPSSYFIVEGADFNKVHTVALSYLQLFFQPHFAWKHTTLKIENSTVKELGIDDTLYYKTCPNKHRCLSIVLPNFETNNPRIQSDYVKAFAPYVNELEIDYERTVTYDNACESFLYKIIFQCNALRSLAVYSGNCSQPWTLPKFSNTSLQTLVLSGCFLSSEFAVSLSSNCVNLSNLTLVDNRYSKTRDNMDYFSMPDTELKQLNLNLDQFKTGLFGQARQTLIKISDNNRDWYFYTDYEKQHYMVPGQRKMEQGRQVVFKFKKIERLRAFHVERYEDTFELSCT